MERNRDCRARWRMEEDKEKGSKRVENSYIKGVEITKWGQ
jgi:hypothetical protein